jgi:Major Facilitator Superfamily
MLLKIVYLLAAGIALMIAGLCLLAVSAWTSPPSLALFLAGGIVAGTGIGAIIRGSLTVVISTASPDDRAGALATFFTAGYAGVSVPVVGVGIILQHLSPRVTLLIFAVAVGLVILAAAAILIRPQTAAAPRAAWPDQLAGTTETTLADTAHANCMDELCTAHGMSASTPSGSTELSGKRPHRTRNGGSSPSRPRHSDQCTNDHLSHAGYRTVEAAEAPDESYPGTSRPVVARARSGHRERGQEQPLRRCGGVLRRNAEVLAVAGLPDCWDQLVDQVREPPRKAGFIREFEKVVTEVTPEAEPSFLEKARPLDSGGMISRSR